MANLKIGVVGIPGAWSTEVLADEVEAVTGTRHIIDFADVRLDLGNQRALSQGLDLCDFDALIVKKIGKSYSPKSLDRLTALQWIADQGVKVFSDPVDMGRLINRLSCTLILNSAGIPMPETSICESVEQAIAAVEKYECAILKPFYSTKARGMLSVTSGQEDLAEILEAFSAENPVMYIQKRVHIPGRDLGMMFLAGEYLGTYARVANPDSWNTTIHDGGKYAVHEPRQKTIDIATKAQGLFNLAFTTVDVVETDNDDDTIVFEVSAFGGFKGAKTALDLDVAKLYVEHVMDVLSE